MASSIAHNTEARRLGCIESSIATVVGRPEAMRLMRVAEEYELRNGRPARKLEPLTVKLARLMRSPSGRLRLGGLTSLAEVRDA